MMTPAYEEIYLPYTKDSLASMLDYAVYDCKYDGAEFLQMFVASGIASEFEIGSPKYIVGMSGIELARKIIETVTDDTSFPDPNQPTLFRSEEYWIGWILAEYQWYSGYSFKEIIQKLTYDTVFGMYRKYHEIDPRHFYEAADKYFQ